MKARDPLTRNYVLYVTLCVVFSTQRGAPDSPELAVLRGRMPTVEHYLSRWGKIHENSGMVMTSWEEKENDRH